MKFIPSQLVACAGIAALGAAGLFAVAPHAQKSTTTTPEFVSSVETVLGMNPTQKDATQTAFEQARQAAQPIRQELMNTRKSLKAAVRSDDSAQIQRLATVEGQEIGQLAAIRSTAVAKVYKTLTPDQRTKATALEQLLMPEHMRAAA
jgi:hypothetical protein